MIQIIVADPDSAARKALTLLLQFKLEETIIIEAGDVETLISILAGNSPDLLLLDWRLYGSPAPYTCRLLQKAYPNLKIILLSVNADDESAAREAGADFIHKGASPDELIAKFTALVSKQTEAGDPGMDTGTDPDVDPDVDPDIDPAGDISNKAISEGE